MKNVVWIRFFFSQITRDYYLSLVQSIEMLEGRDAIQVDLDGLEKWTL